eukprot:4347716-Alexandrium_andersonii.AAC.1
MSCNVISWHAHRGYILEQADAMGVSILLIQESGITELALQAVKLHARRCGWDCAGAPAPPKA